jgi:hypothetical protein
MINEQTIEQLWKEHQGNISKEKWKIHKFIRGKFHKSRIPEMLFRFFETHLKICESDRSEVIVTKQLTSDSLQALIAKNEVAAIHVPGFCPPNVAESLSKRALEEYTHWKLGGVVSTDMFYAGGSIPGEATNHSWPDFRRYYGEREDFVRKQRAMSGGTWPVDHLRLELDEAWPFGACLGQYLGQKFRPAIMRIMQEKNDLNLSIPEYGFIHTDDFPKLKPSRGTYSANIYLKIPEEGGELYIWSINLKRIKGIYNYLSAQILAMVMNEGYFFDIVWQQKIFKLLPTPHIIKPKLGDLVIFHSGRPHSVAPVTKGVRVTNQLFIDARGRVPLTIRS